MANAITQLIEDIAQVKAATTIVQAVGIRVPDQLVSAAEEASAFLGTVEHLEVPHTVASAVNDAAQIANAIAPMTNGTNLGNVVDFVRKIPATEANLKGGQITILGTTPASFDGEHDTVIIAAYRASGVFAKLVNQGVNDAADVK